MRERLYAIEQMKKNERGGVDVEGYVWWSIITIDPFFTCYRIRTPDDASIQATLDNGKFFILAKET